MSIMVNREHVPDHVPDELILPIGLTEGAEFLADPHGFMADLHLNKPKIFFSPQSETSISAWMAPRYEDCFFILRHPELFTTVGSVPFPRSPENYFDFIPLEIDPPHHHKYRSILNPMFSPAAIAELEGYIRQLCNDLIDSFIASGKCEFTTEFGRPLPVSIFLQLMGLPQEMRDTFVGWAMDLLHSQSHEKASAAMMAIAGYLSQVITEKGTNPDDGVISTIVHAKPDGKPLAPDEIFGFVFFLFIGGLDTVFATLNHIFYWLANNPKARKQLIDNPEIIPMATEELLRVFSVTFSARTLTQDYEMHGVLLKKGDKINCVLPAANYDPEVFENPKNVDFDRPRKPNLAFAGGVHSCMGAHLARLEVKICIEEFLRRIPDFKVADGFNIEYFPGGVVGPKSLPLVWG